METDKAQSDQDIVTAVTDYGAESLVSNGDMWFPEAANAYARNVDFLHSVIYYVSIFLFIGIVGVALWFSYKFRYKKDNKVAKKQISEGIVLELLWTIIPFFAVMVLFGWGFKDYLKGQSAPIDAMEIKVIAQKWNWVFEYPEGFKSPGELVVPLGRPVKLIMVSRDVLHSFFLPNFRIKRDVIPYRYTGMVVRPEEVGTYQVFCTEYCGDQHSTMAATMKVVSPLEYKMFLEEAKAQLNIPPVELGAQLYEAYGCNACHSIDGSAMTGPTWKGLFGSQRQFVDGSSAIADETYLRSSIVAPSTQVVNGYGNVMPSFGYLNDTQIEGLIEYIKTLK